MGRRRDDDDENTKLVPRATVPGRLDRRDEAPPLPFAATGDSRPPPHAVDLYEGEENGPDPFNVTAKAQKVDATALPFQPNPSSVPPPPSSDHEGPLSDPIERTEVMRRKVHEDALPFRARPRPKHPPRRLVPLHDNPLWSGAGPTSLIPSSSAPARRRPARVVLVVLVLVVAAVAAGAAAAIYMDPTTPSHDPDGP